MSSDRFWLDSGCFGSFLAGLGWFRVVSGWVRVVSGCFGWVRMVSGGFGSFQVLSITVQQYSLGTSFSSTAFKRKVSFQRPRNVGRAKSSES